MDHIKETIAEIGKRNSMTSAKLSKCESCKNDLTKSEKDCIKNATNDYDPSTPFELYDDEFSLCGKCRADRTQVVIKRRQSSVESILKGYAIPTGLLKYKRSLDAFKWVSDYAKSQRGLCILGDSGIGKTIATIQIVRYWLDDWCNDTKITTPVDNQWKFVSCAGFIMRIQDAWKSGEESAYQMLRK